MLIVTTPNGSEQTLVDSSGWLEYITADTKSQLFAPYLESEYPILVPTIVLYEVRKILLLRHTKLLADTFVSTALRHNVVPLDQEVALAASTISIHHGLPMADALLYATAEKRGA